MRLIASHLLFALRFLIFFAIVVVVERVEVTGNVAHRSTDLFFFRYLRDGFNERNRRRRESRESAVRRSRCGSRSRRHLEVASHRWRTRSRRSELLGELRLRRWLRNDRTASGDNRIDVDIEIGLEQTIGDCTPVLEQPSETLIRLLTIVIVDEIRRTSDDHLTLWFLSAGRRCRGSLTRSHDRGSEDFGNDVESERVRGEEWHLRKEGDEVDEEGEVGGGKETEDDLS